MDGLCMMVLRTFQIRLVTLTLPEALCNYMTCSYMDTVICLIYIYKEVILLT